jgi:hypothetical protein
MPSIINATTTTGLVSSADTSGELRLATNNGNVAVTINTLQNVGIGTTSPTYKLSVADTGSDHQLWVRNTGTAASDDAIILVQTSSTGTTNTISGLYFGDGDSSSVGRLNYNHDDNSMVFFTNSATALTLSSTGGMTIARTDVAVTPVANDGNVFSGTYTPVQVSTNSNISSVSFGDCQYMRVGNTVTVAGQITIDINVLTADSIVNMSLPIASNISSSRQIAGTGTSISSVYAANSLAILGNTTSNCVQIRLNPTVNTSLIYTFSFTYQVV